MQDLNALSKDQMHAVLHGTNSNQSWSVVQPPQWPFEIPSWVKDFRVDWMDGYANRPHYNIMVESDFFEKDREEDYRYEYVEDGKSSYYIAVKEDRCKVHHHGRLLSEIDHETKFIGWGQGPGLRDSNPGFSERCRETEKRWATAVSTGYGGRSFLITMADERKAVLRGPFHGGAPSGYTDVTIVPDELNGRPQRRMHETRAAHFRAKGIRFKWDQTGYFGTFVSEDLIARCLARFQPHLRLAHVRMWGRDYLEPRFAGQPPKNMKLEGQDLFLD